MTQQKYAVLVLTMENAQLRRLLRAACDEGLIYWEPQTQRGFINKALLLAQINHILKVSNDQALVPIAPGQADHGGRSNSSGQNNPILNPPRA